MKRKSPVLCVCEATMKRKGLCFLGKKMLYDCLSHGPASRVVYGDGVQQIRGLLGTLLPYGGKIVEHYNPASQV